MDRRVLVRLNGSGNVVIYDHFYLILLLLDLGRLKRRLLFSCNEGCLVDYRYVFMRPGAYRVDVIVLYLYAFVHFLGCIVASWRFDLLIFRLEFSCGVAAFVLVA